MVKDIAFRGQIKRGIPIRIASQVVIDSGSTIGDGAVFEAPGLSHQGLSLLLNCRRKSATACTLDELERSDKVVDAGSHEGPHSIYTHD